MKTKKRSIALAIAFLTQITFIGASEVPTVDVVDPDIAEFEMVEVTTHEPAKKTKATIQDVKNMMTKTEKKLNQVKDLVESDELKGMAKVLRQMKNSLHKMLFKEGPGFEISNKTNESIWVSVISFVAATEKNMKVGKNLSAQKEFGYDEVLPGERYTIGLKGLMNSLLIGIYTTEPSSAVMYSDEGKTLMPTPDYLYKTTKGARGKTKYFTWNPEKTPSNPKKYLYPQTGALGGLAKVTRSRYSLKNNIQSFELVLKKQKEVAEE